MAAVGGGDYIIIDPAEWNRLQAELRAFEPALALSLRRRLKAAGEEAKKGIQGVLAESPPSGGGRSVGVRAALSAATTVSVSFAQRGAGIKIKTSGSRLPAGHSAMLKAYNRASWRHPVFGKSGTYVSQLGNPYFGKVINEMARTRMAREVEAALGDAMLAIGARGL